MNKKAFNFTGMKVVSKKSRYVYGFSIIANEACDLDIIAGKANSSNPIFSIPLKKNGTFSFHSDNGILFPYGVIIRATGNIEGSIWIGAFKPSRRRVGKVVFGLGLEGNLITLFGEDIVL